jgi:hypothetical protein
MAAAGLPWTTVDQLEEAFGDAAVHASTGLKDYLAYSINSQVALATCHRVFVLPVVFWPYSP